MAKSITPPWAKSSISSDFKSFWNRSELLTPWARPVDVHGVEFPQPVSGRRIPHGLTVFLLGAIAGALFAFFCIGLLIHNLS